MELSPATVVLMGGPNSTGDPGVAILRRAPYVDAVFFGEVDEVFSETVRALEDGAPLSLGLLRGQEMPAGEVGVDVLPFRLARDLETMPVYDCGCLMPRLGGVSPEHKELRPMPLVEGWQESDLSAGLPVIDPHPRLFGTVVPLPERGGRCQTSRVTTGSEQ